MKKKSWIPVAIFLAAGSVFLFSFIQGKISAHDAGAPTTEESDEVLDGAQWKDGALISGHMLFYENDGLCYKDLKTGKGGKLCNLPGCLHNSDDCLARFDSDVSINGIYAYEEKLYLAGSSQDAVILYRCDADGSNHEEVCRIPVGKDGYSTILWDSYLKSGTNIYAAVTVMDESDTHILEDGTMSDAPGMARLFQIDLRDGAFSHIYDFQECYQCFLNLQYIAGDQIYYDFEGDASPYEEVYDPETGERRTGEDESDLSYVGVFDLAERSDRKLEDRTAGDFIGYDGKDTYYAELDHGKMTGKIECMNYVTGDKSRFRTDLIKDLIAGESSVRLIGSGFVVNVQKQGDGSPGEIIFFDRNGRQVQRVSKSRWFIVGEYRDYYLLAGSAVSAWMSAYVPKDDIKNVNRRKILLS